MRIPAILENPFVLGTITVLASSWAMFLARDVPKKAIGWALRHVVFMMEVTNETVVYEWVRAYVAHQSTRAKFVEGRLSPVEPGESGWQARDQRRLPFILAPRAFCVIRCHGRRVLVWLWREQLQFSTGYREGFVFRTLFGGRKTFLHLLEDARNFAANKNGSIVEIWTPQQCDWRVVDRKPARRAESLCLTEEAQTIFDDAKRFLASREWYLQMGIPCRRGYLLHGPPGNGKSSLAHALASELGLGINVANLSSFGSDQTLLDSLRNAPPGNILLLEDIDAAWNGREGTKTTALSFSGLLNAIDGVTARDGQIVVMTTNHRDKLDPALVRPGRADVTLFIDDASEDQAAAMFARFFPDAPASAARLFAAEYAGKSMARIQEHLLANRDDMQAALSESSDDAVLQGAP